MTAPLSTIARHLVRGHATAPALVLDEPLSFWGGLDPETGCITDVHHPQHGVCISGTTLVMPFGRGSSSASSVLAEAIRIGTAPAAIVLTEADEILVLGALVGRELYGVTVPIVVAKTDISQQLATGRSISIEAAHVTTALD